MKKRCDWAGSDPLMQNYHDTEWGIPLHDDRRLFEFLVLEGFQAGLSWSIVLKKREAFREAFAGFDPDRVAAFTSNDVDKLMKNEKIIRNRKKIEATVKNAACFREIQAEYGSFDRYIWSFTDFMPVVNAFEKLSDLPASTGLSDRITASLKSKGFTFVGSTVVYAHLQATGMVNDHLVHCFRYDELRNSAF